MARGAAEPTEAPTPRRLAEARLRGEVASSRDLTAALSLGGLVLVLSLGAPALLGRLLALVRVSLAGAALAPGQEAGGAGGARALAAGAALALDTAIAALLVPLSVLVVVALLAGALQTGGLFVWRPLRWPSFLGGRGSAPARAPGPLGRARGLAGAVPGVLMVAAVAAAVLSAAAPLLPRLAGASPRALLGALGILGRRLAVSAVVALLAVGVIDFLLARRRHRRALMMTRDEARRERRETEGDPWLRAERLRRHRADAAGLDVAREPDVVAAVAAADFVAVSPGQVAVAVRYDPRSGRAPVVVARGERLRATWIADSARAAAVPVHPDATLAEGLYRGREGAEIAADLFQPVATLLAALEARPSRGGKGSG
jgi:flagellar biosynthesis protein FlhB